MERHHAPHRKRLSEWTNPWLLGIGVGLLLIGLPMLLWLMTYHSEAAVAMFVITWLSLTVIVLVMVKNSQTDPRYFVDRKVIERTRREIVAHRVIVRKELLKNEIETLQRGEKTPVLEVWRLDASLTKRHLYFSQSKSLLVDPILREFHQRVQIGEIGLTAGDSNSMTGVLFKDIIAYLGIIATDPYLLMLQPFFNVMVLQIDSIREDERHVDVPFPIFSLLIHASKMTSTQWTSNVDKKRLYEIAEIRFDEGREIQPHRSVDLPFAEGLL